MDDFERDMIVIELTEEWQEMEEEFSQDRQPPDWWLIACGAKDAPDEVYRKSLEVRGTYLRFCQGLKDKTFFEMIDLFTLANVKGCINKISEVNEL